MTTKTHRIFGEHDQKTIDQLTTCLESDQAIAGALCADGHFGYSMPIGGVVSYDNAVSPSGVGYDIACGNKAVQTDLMYATVFNDVPKILDEINARISFGMGRSNEQEKVDHELFDSPLWPEIERLSRGLKQKAQAQLGTVGGGNHYVDLLVDEEGILWVANHFGSRGFGHTIAKGFLNLAANRDFNDHARDREEPTVLPLNTELGASYWAMMGLAGEYAYAGRDYVMEQVLEILGAQPVVTVHNHHNFAWVEASEIVVRKGATPLTRELAFIGGSMGDMSVIVRGAPPKDWAGQPLPPPVADIGAIGSAPHGAGRAMSRTKAAGKVRKRKLYGCSVRSCSYVKSASEFKIGDVCPEHESALRKFWKDEQISEGLIDWPAVKKDLFERGIIVVGAAADEAPGAYKDLATVLAQHTNIEIVQTLLPVGVVMAGANVVDLYKD
jgi:tRNA-splicing ligase RtcB